MLLTFKCIRTAAVHRFGVAAKELGPPMYLSNNYASHLATVTGTLPVVSSSKTRHLKYIKTTHTSSSPNILLIPGYIAGKEGDKALALQHICDKHKLNFIRYDPTGIGETKGVAFENARFSDWLEDATQMIEHIVDPGKTIIIGSSLGGWMSCYLAWKYPEKFQGLMLFCPAFNAAQVIWDLILANISEESQHKLEAGETVKIITMNDWVDFTLSKDVRNDMKAHNLPLTPSSIKLSCPVRIIHAVNDVVIPYKGIVSRNIMEMFHGDDVEVSLVKRGGHELVDERCLKVVERMVCELAALSLVD